MEKHKSSYNNNKFKISAPTWSDEFELPDGSYSIFLRNTMKILTIHQSEYTQIKLKIELHLKLNMDIILKI